MKRLFYFALALVLITTAGCKRKNKAERQYERYLNDSNRVEFVTPTTDTVDIEVEELESDKDPVETEGLFSIPDIVICVFSSFFLTRLLKTLFFSLVFKEPPLDLLNISIVYQL